MKRLHINSFSIIAGLTYCIGITGFIMNIINQFPIQEMPDVIHVVILVLAGYSGMGFVLYFRKVPFKSIGDKTLYSLIAFHLCLSAILHLYSLIYNTNEWITVFPAWYPYFGLLYFVVFAVYSLRLKKRINSNTNR